MKYLLGVNLLERPAEADRGEYDLFDAPSPTTFEDIRAVDILRYEEWPLFPLDQSKIQVTAQVGMPDAAESRESLAE